MINELGTIHPDHSSESLSSINSPSRLSWQNPSGVIPLHRNRPKRVFDLIIASALILFLLPLLIALAVLVKADGGSALFGHRRIGASGRSFRCMKFRSMAVDADQALARLLASDAQARAEWQRDFKLRNDPRITPIGRILRKTSLDELPQLFNVVTGEMSLVGPRPIVEAEVERYDAAFKDYCRCRPGITGLWQVSGRNDVAYQDRVLMDRHYARSWSFGLDLLILMKTIVVVTRRRGSY